MSASALAMEPQTPIDREFEVLQARFPLATITPIGGAHVVSVPDVRLPSGWNKQVVTAHFIVPVGYPHANPDCFNVDVDLRLASGAIPQNAAIQSMPHAGQTLWFSYHLQRPWKPGRDTLLTWMGVVAARLSDVR